MTAIIEYLDTLDRESPLYLGARIRYLGCADSQVRARQLNHTEGLKITTAMLALEYKFFTAIKKEGADLPTILCLLREEWACLLAALRLAHKPGITSGNSLLFAMQQLVKVDYHLLEIIDIQGFSRHHPLLEEAFHLHPDAWWAAYHI